MKKWASAFTVASCATLLLACGGGGSDGPPAPAPSVSVGTITGFGSVIVNGVRFDDAGAAVLINDQVATSTQLKVGMVVAVEGSVSACPNADTALCEGIATRIRFRNNLVGPITTINRLTNTVQVMGRDVVVDDSTVFDGTTANDLSGLSVGDTLAVSGLTEQVRVRARLVQRLGTFANGMTPITLHGVVANVDAVAGTCTVDGVEQDDELSVVAWTNYTDTDDGSRYISKMDEIPVTDNGMVFVVAFVPRGEAVTMPPWAAQLPELGAADMGQLRPEDLTTTTVAESTDATETTVADDGE